MCATTCLDDEKHKHIPDDQCFVHKWGDHIKCIHDLKWSEKQKLNSEIIYLKKKCKESLKNEDYKILQEKQNEISKYNSYNPDTTFCIERKFRWYKGYVGIIPKILSKLTSERYLVKAEIGNLKKIISDEQDKDKENELKDKINAFDGKQNALKIVANALYGFCGAKSDFENLLPIAMCTTFCGRMYIQQISDFIKKKYNGRIIYGDTDSNYVQFPDMDYKDLNSFCFKVADEISNLFGQNSVIKILYEEKIMHIINVKKKNYLMKLLNESNKIKAKGVMMVKRDNCSFIIDFYKQVINLVFDEIDFDDIIYFLIQNCLLLICRQVDPEKLKISKSVGSWGDGTAVKNSDGSITIGKYKVRKIDGDEKFVQDYLVKNNFSSLNEYYRSCLPASIQLVFRLLDRGNLITPGERIDYIVTGLYNTNDKLEKRIERIDYFRENSEILDIDYLHYLKKLFNALDDLFFVVFKKEYNFNFDSLNCIGARLNKTNCKKCFYCLTRLRLFLESKNGPCLNLYLQFYRKLKMNEEFKLYCNINKFYK